jgi:hypothetical protein
MEHARGDGDRSQTCLAYRLFATVLRYGGENEVHLTSTCGACAARGYGRPHTAPADDDVSMWRHRQCPQLITPLVSTAR